MTASDSTLTQAASTKLGRSELLFQLSSGGMGTVYLARQRGVAQFERLVVVKRVHPHFAKDPEFRSMLLEEGRLSSYVRHPNAVGALEVGEESDELFLVFEYVEALSLAALIRAVKSRGDQLAAATVSRILSDVLAGLHAAHEARDVRGRMLDIIHRDVSPQNVIVGTDGSSRLIDFGVAKASAHIGTTRDGAIKGKLRYMSPEQLRRRGVDRRSDLFACGSVLFEALTGKKLFDGEDEGAIVMSIMLGPEEKLAEAAASLPAAILPVLMRALATEADQRFSTAAEFQEALEAAIPPVQPREVAAVVESYAHAEIDKQRQRIREAAEALDTSPGGVEDPTVTEISLVEAPAPRKNPWKWRGAAVGAAAGLLGIAFLVHRGSPAADAAPAAESAAPAVASAAPSATSIASSAPEPSTDPSRATPDGTASSAAGADSKGAAGHPSHAAPKGATHLRPPASAALHKSPYGAP